jgi:hypothetical protein
LDFSTGSSRSYACYAARKNAIATRETAKKVTVVLKPRHIADLDLLSLQIRHKTGKVI